MWDSCVGGRRYFTYYSYRRNPTGREFFVPAGTLIAVKLLRGYHYHYDFDLDIVVIWSCYGVLRLTYTTYQNLFPTDHFF